MAQEPNPTDTSYPTAAASALEFPAVAALAQMMRLGWGIYYQAQAEIRAQLVCADWPEEQIAQAVTDLAKAEQLAIRTNGPPTLAELDATLNAFGRGLVSALRSSAETVPEADEDEGA
jgi:hypothetical protein